jgi:hypothetical protein
MQIERAATLPKEIQRKRIKGYRMPPNTVSVARPGTWGNPHVVGEGCGDAATACTRYAHDLITLRLVDRAGVPLLNRLGELRGKNLACFCPIGQPCHRQVLLHYANLGEP